MDLIEEMRSELSALSEHFPKGAELPELAGYFGVPLRQLEPAINALEIDGILRLNGERVSFLNLSGETTAQRNGRKGGVRRAVLLLEDDEASRLRRLELRDAVRAAGQEIGHAPSLDDTVTRIRDALPLLAEHYPQGISAREIAATLGIQPERCYRAVAQAISEGWCEEVKAHGNRVSGNIAVFEGMLVPPPKLTALQQQVYDWIVARAGADGRCEVNMRQCAIDLKMSLVNDKLDSMERKGFIARLTRYQKEGGVKISPTYMVLPPPAPRPPEFTIGSLDNNRGGWDTRMRNAAAREIQQEEEAKYEQEVAEIITDPIAVIRARKRKAELTAEMKRIDRELDKVEEFLSMYAKLTK